ncbi:MAG TPA: tetratricopeptide repeat protein [Chthoniobacteraceae bacterium]|nr:tetratricopeptide repeat protein [Chthoniobacteraceae bacterium]
MLRRLLGGQQWERALEVARQWLAQDPGNAEAHFAAAQALTNLNRPADARVHIDKVLAVLPNHSFAHRLAAIIYFRQGKVAEAEEKIQRAIQLAPDSAMNWYQLGLMRYHHGALDAAERHARHALEFAPDNADIINLIAICQKGNPVAQRVQYHRALEYDPENATVHSNLGYLYLSSDKNYAAAEESFRRALQIDPANDFAQRGLFLTLRQRDPVYRALTLPRIIIYKSSWSRGGLTVVLRIALVVVWLALGRFILLLFAAWLLLMWPLVKAYEYLTLSDIRARAGIVGARRGGWKNLHRWPLPVRLATFGLLILCFWGGLFALYAYHIVPEEWLIGVAVLVLVLWYAATYSRLFKRARRRAAARKAERKFQSQSKVQDPY